MANSGSKQYIATVTNGKFPRNVHDAIAGFMRMCEGKRIVVTIGEYKEKRSTPQRNFYFGVIVPAIIRMHAEGGTIFPKHKAKDMAHAFIQREILGRSDDWVDVNGKLHEDYISSEDQNTAEQEINNERVRVWMAERGEVLPFPNEGEYD